MFSYLLFKGWFFSMLGTILIIILAYFRWKNNFLKVLGLNLKPVTIVKSIAVAVLIAAISYLFMQWLANKNGIEIRKSNWQNYFHDVFYVINEEMVLGAILLFILKKKFNPLNSSIILAFAFSVVHFIFYQWVFDEKAVLVPATILTLFFVGLLRNNLILIKKHIGYSWAFHFGWMLIMFGARHYNSSTKAFLTESDRFNLYLGSLEMVFISLFLGLASTWFLWKKMKNQKAAD
jgi:hypothetical protein